MALACTVVQSSDELVRFEPAWRDLLERSSVNGPTVSPLWLGTWWRVFGRTGGRRLCAALFWQRERLVGLAPLQSRLHFYRPGIPFQRIELLASGEPEADEICSEYLGVIAEQGLEEAVAEALAQGLSAGRLGSWDEAVFPAMAADHPMPEHMVRAFRKHAVESESVPCGCCPYVALPADWDGYLASLASSDRYFVKRALREFENWANGSAEICEARSPADLECGMRILQSLHGERWGNAGVFRSRQFTAFHDGVMRSLFAENALALLWLKVRGNPIAATYNVIWKGKEYFYQSGRKLDVPKCVRPGIVLHAHAIRRAIEAGRTEYDFLAGPSRYKRQLATASHGLVTVRAVRAPLRDWARRTARRGFGLAARWRDRALAMSDMISEAVPTRCPRPTRSSADDSA